MSKSASSSTLHSRVAKFTGPYSSFSWERNAHASIRILPVRREILLGVLYCDLIGFHTYDYARHFLSSCTRILNLPTMPNGVEFEGRLAHVGTFPIGIEPKSFIDVSRIIRHLIHTFLTLHRICKSLASSTAYPSLSSDSGVSRLSLELTVWITSRVYPRNYTHLSSS